MFCVSGQYYIVYYQQKHLILCNIDTYYNGNNKVNIIKKYSNMFHYTLKPVQISSNFFRASNHCNPHTYSIIIVLLSISKPRKNPKPKYRIMAYGPCWCPQRGSEWVPCVCGCYMWVLNQSIVRCPADMAFIPSGTQHFIFAQCSEMYLSSPDPCCSHTH